MGHTDPVAHDPSVADYRATSPRCAQGKYNGTNPTRSRAVPRACCRGDRES